MSKSVNKEYSSLSIRFKRESTTMIGQVIGWLNSLEPIERRSKIEQALIMAYLSISKFDSQASDTEINRAYWESDNLWNFHQFNLRQLLNISLQENVKTSSSKVDNQDFFDSKNVFEENVSYHDPFGEN